MLERKQQRERLRELNKEDLEQAQEFQKKTNGNATC